MECVETSQNLQNPNTFVHASIQSLCFNFTDQTNRHVINRLIDIYNEQVTKYNLKMKKLLDLKDLLYKIVNLINNNKNITPSNTLPSSQSIKKHSNNNIKTTKDEYKFVKKQLSTSL